VTAPARRTTYQTRRRIAEALSLAPLPLPRLIGLFGSDKEQAGQHAYGATYAAPEFGRTCVGEFLALTPYLNHQEFMTLEGADETRLALGRRIRRISFEHNLIIVEKGPNAQPSNSLPRPS
jgi:hypothetical protein